MTSNKTSQIAMIRAALADLDGLAHAEYGVPLESLLVSIDSVSELRVQRLVGIALKRKFATPVRQNAYSATGALRSWPWPDSGDSLVPVDRDAAPELALLEELRKPGGWNERKPLTGTRADTVPVAWSTFKDDAEHERGLFKILALYASDRFNKQKGRTLKAYLDAPESKPFEAGLDIATLLFDTGVIGPLVSVLGVPSLAIGVALVGIQYGYRKLTDPSSDRVGDSNS